jgi:hypothetical protein
MPTQSLLQEKLQEQQGRSLNTSYRRQSPPYIQLTLLWALSSVLGAATTIIALEVGGVQTIVAISLAIALPLGWISFIFAIRKIVAVMLLPKMVAAFSSVLIMSSVLAGVAAIISINLTLFGIEPWIYFFLGVTLLLSVIAQTLVQPTVRSILIFAARALTGTIAGTLAVASVGVTNLDRITVGATTGTLVAAIVSLLLDSTLKTFTKENYPKSKATKNIFLAVSSGLILGAGFIFLNLKVIN